MSVITKSRKGNSAFEELLKENEVLRKENALLKSIIDSIHEAVYAVNEKDEVILYNSESEKMEGVSRDKILGKVEDEAFAQPYYFPDEISKRILITGKPEIEQPYLYYLHDGRKTNMVFSAYPFYYNGKIAGVYIIFRNFNQMSDFISSTFEMHKRFLKARNEPAKGAKYLLDDIVGNSTISKIKEEARRIARRNSPVLIVGETGTGKELFAQGLHNASLYSNGPFIPVNCAAIPDTLLESLLFGTTKGAFTGAVESPGLFEQAEDGTLFLDEINSMPMSLQSKLLRVLQDKSVRRLGSTVEIPLNCRIISATNRDPLEAVDKKLIRSDLYFRLATITLNIPPLRERKEDIKALTMHFITKYNAEFGLFVANLSEEVLDLFFKYSWPGNIRELENYIEGAMNFVQSKDKTLHIEHFPEYFRGVLLQEEAQGAKIFTGTLQSVLLDTEKKFIEFTLERNNKNITKAARELGISRQNLHYKLKTLGISR